ncbi:hypothetical protein BX24_21090, partial [Escherichia coli O91:H21 str. 2009C-4646]
VSVIYTGANGMPACSGRSTLWLTKARYQYLLRLDAQPLPESRIALLLHLVSDKGASLEEVEAQPFGKRKIIV